MALSTQRDSAFLPSPHQSAPQPNHDVFLSFRGVDTRLSLVSHLYHELQLRGIKTFKDDPKPERGGTTISSELFNAIEESRLAIVVLSPEYASSTWCLDELTKILQCMKSKRTVLPVFYHVDPSDVRKQSGSFAYVFAEHEKRFREDIEKVKRWRGALTEVANLFGFDSKNGSERKLIEQIVEWVWERVHHRFKLLDSTELVGMEFIREQVDLLLALPTDDVRFIGVWGMGGSGKTTIAQLVYDCISTHFEVRSFLANVREVSQRGNLVDLQRQLLSPILKDQITQVWDEKWGTSIIKNCLCNKKVLLILDDVSESSQLQKLAGEKDWFGKGSIIIITTRDKRLLDQHGIVEALGLVKSHVPDEKYLSAKSFLKATSAKWIFLLISLCLEILSIAFDQASSPSNPHNALVGMMLAIAAVLICILELIYKGKNEGVELRRRRTLRRLFGSLPDIYGLVGAVAQCICSTVQYVCFIRHNQNPIKASLLPAIFLICLGASRLTRIRTDETNERNV